MNRLAHLFLALILIALSASKTLAQVVAPTKGGEVTVLLATATSMDLSFGTTGNGQGRVVTISAVAGSYPKPLLAVDDVRYQPNVAYGAGSKLGDGYVVYVGAGHAVTVTNLHPKTLYYISSSEYNTDSASVRYNNWCSSVATSTKPMPATTLATATGATQSLEVYPNPSAGTTVSISLQGYQSEPIALRLVDNLGQEVFSQFITPSGADYTAPLLLPATLNSGSYTLLATGKSSQSRRRLVITN